MAFNERISVVIDLVTDKASAALGGFRKSVNEAEGFTGKLKAGVGSLGSTFTSFVSSPAGAATAVSAVGAVMVKTAGMAADLGLEVGKLADSTGLSTEAASRWLEVGGDLGLTADKTAGLIEKMTQNLGKSPEKFKALGIEVQYAADGTADMNATLLGAIEGLHKIQDPTKRATAAAQLFGKGWADASELIAKGADSVKKKLGEVADVKVLSESDVKDAREFRDTMDQLKDAGEELALSLGKTLLPAITTIADALGVVADVIGPVVEGIGYMMDEVNSAFTDLDDPLHGVADGLIEMAKANEAGIEVAARAGLAQSLEAAALEATTTAATQSAAAAQALADVQQTLTDKALAAAAGMYDVEEATLAADEKYAAYTQTIADGDATLSQLRQQQIDQAQGYADIATKIAEEQGVEADSRAGIALQIAALEDMKAKYPLLADEIQRYIDKLNSIPRDIHTNVTSNAVHAGTTARPGDIAHNARGTNSARPGLSWVGEEGPELVSFKGGEQVIPAAESAAIAANAAAAGQTIEAARAAADALAQSDFISGLNDWNSNAHPAAGGSSSASSGGGTGSGSGGSVTFYNTFNSVGMSAEQIVRALEEWVRRNGALKLGNP